MHPPRPESYPPEVLARLGTVFDDTWAAVEARFEGADAAALAMARSRLAGIMLELLAGQQSTVDLKRRAITLFNAAYPPTVSAVQLGNVD